MNPNAAAFNRLLGFAVKSLPDSINERKALLADILKVMPVNHPLRPQISEMCNALDLHERHQMQLALDFKNAANPERDGGS